MQDTYCCGSKWQKIRADKYTCILIKLGTELPSRAAWMSDTLHYLTLAPQWTAAWLTTCEQRQYFPATNIQYISIYARYSACQSLFWCLRSASSTSDLVPCTMCSSREHNPLLYLELFHYGSHEQVEACLSTAFFLPSLVLGSLQPCNGRQGREHGQGSKLDVDTCWHLGQSN